MKLSELLVLAQTIIILVAAAVFFLSTKPSDVQRAVMDQWELAQVQIEENRIELRSIRASNEELLRENRLVVLHIREMSTALHQAQTEIVTVYELLLKFLCRQLGTPVPVRPDNPR